MRLKRFLSAALLFLIAAFAWAELQIHFLDVGQGDAIVLRTEDAVVLVDAGQYSDTAEYLARLGIEAIDLAIATHAHADHVGGFPAVFDAHSIQEIWYNGQTHTTRTFERFIDAMLASDAKYHEPASGERVSFGDLVITVLHPKGSAADYSGHVHHMNIVVRVEYHDFSVVLTGDAEVAAEHEIIASGLPLTSTVLRLGHHGSRTSSSAEFLQAVSPQIVVYQAGEGNRYGHPHDEVITLITTEGKSFAVSTERDNEGEFDVACIDINSASITELSRITHISEARARELVEHRPFRSVQGLSRIRGIAESRLQDIRDQGLVCRIE